jgi:hypothetical protein
MGLSEGFAALIHTYEFSGQMVHVQTKLGQMLGTAYVNSRSLIAARLVSRRVETYD